MCPMSLAGLLDLGGGEVILILALILILLGAKPLPEFGEGLLQGLLRHPVLMALTFILGAACLILVAYEFSK